MPQTDREAERFDMAHNIARNADHMIRSGRRRKVPSRITQGHRVLVRNFTRSGKMYAPWRCFGKVIMVPSLKTVKVLFEGKVHTYNRANIGIYRHHNCSLIDPYSSSDESDVWRTWVGIHQGVPFRGNTSHIWREC